jgi:eukaryotic-like serine/threonine-protein kinase
MGTVDDGTPLVHGFEGAEQVDPLLGRTIAGRFVIKARLGSGSMGTVYRATQDPIGREVALKILRTDRAVDDSSRARFLREARANSALSSPHTVTVFDFGQGDDGEFYLAMELLEGESVGDRIRRVGRLGAAEALETARQALTSLAEAHDKGIIHRDLKPDNLFYARVPAFDTQTQTARYGEILKVLDFGVAKMLRDDTDLAMNAVETQAGTVFGTPRYMSPEQAQGKPLDARTDLYSLGVILYHMLTGNPPFQDDDAIVVMARHIKSRVVPLCEASPDAAIPPEVDALVMRALSKEPDLRAYSAEAMLAEVEQAAMHLAVAAPNPVRVSFRPSPAESIVDRAGGTWTGPKVVRTGGRRLLSLGMGAAVVGGLAFAAVLWLLGAAPASKEGPASADTTPIAQATAAPSATVAPSAVPAPAEAPAPAPSVVAPPAPSARSNAGVVSAAHHAHPRPVTSAPAPGAPSKKKVGYGYLE